LSVGSRVVPTADAAFGTTAVYVSCSTVGCGVSALEREGSSGELIHGKCGRCGRMLVDTPVVAVATGAATLADIAAKPLETRTRYFMSLLLRSASYFQ
jgi:hypothetical protein